MFNWNAKIHATCGARTHTIGSRHTTTVFNLATKPRRPYSAINREVWYSFKTPKHSCYVSMKSGLCCTAGEFRAHTSLQISLQMGMRGRQGKMLSKTPTNSWDHYLSTINSMDNPWYLSQTCSFKCWKTSTIREESCLICWKKPAESWQTCSN